MNSIVGPAGFGRARTVMAAFFSSIVDWDGVSRQFWP